MRHPNLTLVTHDIARTLHGRAAEKIIRDTQPPVGHSPAEPATIYILPLWAWGMSRMNVGRKDRWTDGNRLEMPIRLEWDVPLIGFVADLPNGTASYVTRSAGYDEVGAVDVVAAAPTIYPGLDDMPLGVDWDPSPSVLTASVPSFARKQLLSDIATSGKEGFWSMLGRIEEHARYEIPKAIASLSMSAFGPEWGQDRGLIDQVDRSLLISRFTLGDEDAPRSPAVRLIERCLTPGAFEKADPQKVMTTSVHRDVKEEVRKMIGDPREGAAIRETARSIGIPVGSISPEVVEEVSDAHNNLHPTRRVGAQRVRSALTVIHNAPSISASEQDFGQDYEGAPPRIGQTWGAVR